jgi:hypothetical protein
LFSTSDRISTPMSPSTELTSRVPTHNRSQRSDGCSVSEACTQRGAFNRLMRKRSRAPVDAGRPPAVWS